MATDDDPAVTGALALCDGLPCRMAGARGLAAELATLAGPAPGRTGCLGHCDRAPAAHEGRHVLAPASFGRVSAAHDHEPGDESDPGFAGYVDFASYRAAGGYDTSLHPPRLAGAALLQALEDAGVPGAGRLRSAWQAAPDPARPLVLQVSRGADGDFRDRALVEGDPHRVLEGALAIARALALPAIAVQVCSAHEACLEILAEEIEALHLELPLTDLPALRLGRQGATDEASAALQAPVPALRVDAETLSWVREVLELGPDRFAALGRPGFRGRRAVALSGRVAQPGLKRVAAGTTVLELIEQHGGGLTGGQRLGGFLAGTLIGPAHATLPFDSAALQGVDGSAETGALVVLGEGDLALALGADPGPSSSVRT